MLIMSFWYLHEGAAAPRLIIMSILSAACMASSRKKLLGITTYGGRPKCERPLLARTACLISRRRLVGGNARR